MTSCCTSHYCDIAKCTALSCFLLLVGFQQIQNKKKRKDNIYTKTTQVFVSRKVKKSYFNISFIWLWYKSFSEASLASFSTLVQNMTDRSISSFPHFTFTPLVKKLGDSSIGLYVQNMTIFDNYCICVLFIKSNVYCIL